MNENTTNKPNLFAPLTIGAMTLPNRITMAPLTRMRAAAGNVPHADSATYYRQRASAGLLISEASQIMPAGQGYLNTPGIHSADQIAGWRPVTAAVHQAGGSIFLQLWHVGRISHPDFQPNGQRPVSASAVKPTGHARTASGKVPFVTPRALETAEIPAIVAQYGTAASNAIAAGFDGIEIHGANGYLIDQFLRDGTNERSDQYGGSIANRVRFLDQVAAAAAAAIGAERVGVRLSPANRPPNMVDSDVEALFRAAVGALSGRGLAYLHIFETDEWAREFTPTIRALFDGPLMLNGDYDRQRAIEVVESGLADMVAFGRLFISNPDLPKRLRLNAPLTPPDRKTFYGGGAKGYTDYPFLERSSVGD